MNQSNWLVAAVACAVLTLPALPAPAVVPGQVDTFEDGTTSNWRAGGFGTHPSPPAYRATGGPAGQDDGYLLVTALGGAGAGSRLSAINAQQWTGDFLAAGVQAVRMDVNNFGPDNLSLRLLFADPTVAPPNNVALSTTAVNVPAGSGWTTVTFPITPADLTATTGTAAVALANAPEMRIFHNPAPEFPGPGAGPPPVTAELAIDNITAVVPEPSALALLALGVLPTLTRRHRHRTRPSR